MGEKSQEIHPDSASSLLAEIQHNKANKEKHLTAVDQQPPSG
jgi:hypothetical protein